MFRGATFFGHAHLRPERVHRAPHPGASAPRQPHFFDAQMLISRAVGQKKTFQRPQFGVIEVLSQVVGMGMFEHTVVAVEGREHALEQRAAGHAGGVKGGVVGEPASPGAHRGEWGDRPGRVSHKGLEPRQPPAKGAHAALAREAVAGVDDAAQEVDALGASLQHGFVRVQGEAEALVQKRLDRQALPVEGGAVIAQQHEVVHIAQVGAHLEAVFHELVEFVEVDVGKELAGEAANGQAHPGRGVVEGFVRRNPREQDAVAALVGRRVDGRLHQDGAGHLVEPRSQLRGKGQAGQVGPPQREQAVPVDTGKKSADVELAVIAVTGLAHELLQPRDGGLGAAALAIGVAVVDKAGVPPGLDMAHQPLLYQAVGKGRGKDLAQLGVGDSKHGEGLRPVAAVGNLRGQIEHQRGQADEMRALVLAVASGGGAGKQLACDAGLRLSAAG